MQDGEMELEAELAKADKAPHSETLRDMAPVIDANKVIDQKLPFFFPFLHLYSCNLDSSKLWKFYNEILYKKAAILNCFGILSVLNIRNNDIFFMWGRSND